MKIRDPYTGNLVGSSTGGVFTSADSRVRELKAEIEQLEVDVERRQSEMKRLSDETDGLIDKMDRMVDEIRQLLALDRANVALLQGEVEEKEQYKSRPPSLAEGDRVSRHLYRTGEREMNQLLVMKAVKWLGDMRLFHEDYTYSLAALLESVADEYQAEIERLKAEKTEIIGIVQRWQPSGSTPPVDARMLVSWICRVLDTRAKQAEAKLAKVVEVTERMEQDRDPHVRMLSADLRAALAAAKEGK